MTDPLQSRAPKVDKIVPVKEGGGGLPDSEFLTGPTPKTRHGWAVIVHEDGMQTRMGIYRWRRWAVRNGHSIRVHMPGPKQVEVRRVL